jgi:hypothetical protein
MIPIQLLVLSIPSLVFISCQRRNEESWKVIKRSGLAPLVLTMSLPYRHPSPRWKDVIEPSPGKFTHHLELWDPEDLDFDVRAWLLEAWQEAG